jgi:hypothetical protein
VTDPADSRAAEWPSLRLALAVAATLALTILGGGSAVAVLEDEPTRFELVEQCLRREKLLEVRPARDDPIAREASGGAIATRVEGNGLHLAIGASEQEAERIAGFYRAVSRHLSGRLEHRRVYVFVWEAQSTSAQRQAVYDCLVY